VADTDNIPDIQMNPDELYREDVYTDQKIGTIRVMTPVKSDGSTDTERNVGDCHWLRKAALRTIRQGNNWHIFFSKIQSAAMPHLK